jgi:hypothetical protein
VQTRPVPCRGEELYDLRRAITYDYSVMRHALHAESFSLRLSLVQVADAAFVVLLRNQGCVKSNVGDSAPDVAGQQSWRWAYFARQGDCYCVVETTGGISVGTYGSAMCMEPARSRADGSFVPRCSQPYLVRSSRLA